jgi:hypothetical protein
MVRLGTGIADENEISGGDYESQDKEANDALETHTFCILEHIDPEVSSDSGSGSGRRLV